MTVAALPLYRLSPDAGLPRWAVSALVVLALHAVAMLAVMTWRVPVEVPEPAPAAIMIDLTPAPAVQPATPAPAPPPPLPPKPIEPPPLPVAPPAPAPAVALPPRPKPKPVPRKPVEHRDQQPPPAPALAAPEPAAPLPAAPRPAPLVPSAPSPQVLSDFQRALLAHLERQKRYPREAQLKREEGVVSLRFTIDRGGRVLSASIARGSGYADLDAEVLEMVRRAEPLPAIPPELNRAQLELVLPVRFYLR